MGKAAEAEEIARETLLKSPLARTIGTALVYNRTHRGNGDG